MLGLLDTASGVSGDCTPCFSSTTGATSLFTSPAGALPCWPGYWPWLACRTRSRSPTLHPSSRECGKLRLTRPVLLVVRMHGARVVGVVGHGVVLGVAHACPPPGCHPAAAGRLLVVAVEGVVVVVGKVVVGKRGTKLKAARALSDRDVEGTLCPVDLEAAAAGGAAYGGVECILRLLPAGKLRVYRGCQVQSVNIWESLIFTHGQQHE